MPQAGYVLLNKYFSCDKIKKNELGGARSTYGDRRCAYGILVWRPDSKRPLDIPNHRCDDTISMDLQAMGWGGMDWINVAQNSGGLRALVNAEMKLRLP
jgi:hypothetical protein